MTTKGLRKQFCKRGHENPVRSKIGACVLCARAVAKERYRKNKPLIIKQSIATAERDPAARRDQQRACRLGVSVDEVRQVIARAAGKCEACGKDITHKGLTIDHCHRTGKIRGVLCRFCNALEGMLNKQIERVAQVMVYVAMAENRFNQEEGRK